MKVKGTEWFDLVACVCLFLGIYVAAYTLEITHWTYDLDRATHVALFSVFFGILVGYSSFSRKRSRFLLFLYALAIIFLQFIFALDDDPSWMNRLLAFSLRVGHTTYALFNSLPLDDGILFLTGITLLFCFAGLSAGFTLVRYGNPWLPYSMFIVAAVIIQFYLPDQTRNYFLLSTFLVFSVLLFGRLAYVKRRIYWKEQRIREDQEVSFSLVKTVALFALLLSFLSIGLPLIVRKVQANNGKELSSISQRVTTTWDLVTNFFFPLRQPGGVGESRFNKILPLGTSRSLSENQVFSVEIPDYYVQSDVRLYWYGRIYATYDGNYWQSKDLTNENLQYTWIDVDDPESAQVYSFLFSYNEPSDIVFRPQETRFIGRATQISYYPIDEDLQDIQVILDPGYIHSGERVIVEGQMRQYSLENLQRAGEDYPQWIKDRYLQLPDGLPASIGNLASEVSTESINVLDKVLEITNHLRTNYAYADQVDIPRGADPLEWFLFEGRTGFCNYYASAEVIMLRTLGIPSRLVVGYAQGEPIEDGQTVGIKEKNSHAWVEVYFPGYGWVIFEPTPTQPQTAFKEIDEELEIEMVNEMAFNRGTALESSDSQADLRGNISEDVEFTAQRQMRLRKTLIWISVTLIALIICIALVRRVFFRVEKNELPILMRKRLESRAKKIPPWLDRWADYEDLGPVQKLFLKLKRYSRWILTVDDKEETPQEYIQRLVVEVELGDPELQTFMDQFHQEVYGNGIPGDWRESEKVYRLALKGIVKKVWQKVIALLRVRSRKR